MKKLIFYMIILSVIFAYDETTKLLVLNPYNTINATHLDEGDISTINMLFVESLNVYIKNIEISSVSCNDDSCALEELSKTGNDQLVYTRLQKLGSKIIFSGTILDGNSSFNSKVTAMNIEDMENVCSRLAKSIAFKELVENVADINNIVEQEQKEPIRRTSISRVGMTGGYLFPLKDTYGGGPGSRVLSLSSTYYYEFANNGALIVDAMLQPSTGFGAHLGFLKFTNIIDSSPFYGFGLGLHRTYSDINEIESSGGPSINFQAGMMLFRTYDINVLVRSRYLHIFNDNSDNAFIIDIGVQKKRNDKKKNGIFDLF